MSLCELTGDLFEVRQGALAHCVSRCFTMGKGIALIFKNKFGGVDELKKQQVPIGGVGVLVRDGQIIYYLVTKEHYYDKPTYDTINSAILAMRRHAVENKVQMISMPRIGCGLDRMQWSIVSTLLTEAFSSVYNIKLNIYVSDIEPFTKSAPPPSGSDISLSKGQKTISFEKDFKTSDPKQQINMKNVNPLVYNRQPTNLGRCCHNCKRSMELQQCGCYKCLNENCQPRERCLIVHCCHLHGYAPQCRQD